MFFKVEKVIVNQDNTNLTYNYTYSKKLSKYFSKKDVFYVNYKEDISTVPKHFLNIPLMSNLTPISWFVGFDIYLETLDENYYNSLLEIKKVFENNFPILKQKKSEIFVKKIVKSDKKNVVEDKKLALLFTGGVDAYCSYFRYADNFPLLIKIIQEANQNKGLDTYELNKSLNDSEFVLHDNEKKYILSNLDSFYTDKIRHFNKGFGWWSHIQHGMGLTGLVAPFGYKYRLDRLLIASSYTSDIKINWGSAPEIDNKISMADLSVFHDSYELKRVDKINVISSFFKKNNKNINLRVCFSSDNTGINCSKCEKCYRTIFGLLINNSNPNNFGFSVDEKIYEKIHIFLKKGFSSEGVRYFWNEMYNYINLKKPVFYKFDSKENENLKLDELIQTLKLKVNSKLNKKNYIKIKILRKFPFLRGKTTLIKNLFGINA